MHPTRPTHNEWSVPYVLLHPPTMDRTFVRTIDSLGEIFSFLKTAIESFELDDRTAFSVNMSVEELFTNMIKYGSSGDAEIEIGLEKEDAKLIVHLVDTDSEPFDLTDLDSVDISAPLQERRPGGLGIHLVKCIMDEVSYEYKNRVTRIRLVKNL